MNPEQNTSKEEITAEEFFRNKLRDEYVGNKHITLWTEVINAEKGMRWAKEFADLKVNEKLKEIREDLSRAKEYITSAYTGSENDPSYIRPKRLNLEERNNLMNEACSILDNHIKQ